MIKRKRMGVESLFGMYHFVFAVATVWLFLLATTLTIYLNLKLYQSKAPEIPRLVCRHGLRYRNIDVYTVESAINSSRTSPTDNHSLAFWPLRPTVHLMRPLGLDCGA